MSDVGHAATDKYFIDLGACNVGQHFDVVWIVRAGDNGLVDIG